ncbi:MAG: response regulator [Candidatus Pacebacteria bacterium]|jgi:DNA-binding response OmpR family regulator|nr:response regulator [Candidatus Paceibacterota bacterium]
MAKQILIVEDDSFLQGLASRKLQSEGYAVFGAQNSKEAFALLDGGLVPDLFLLDLLLPGVDGFEILKEIQARENVKDVPKIIFSNLSEEKDIKRAQDLGVKEFMIKANFTLDELSEKITQTIGK